MGTKSKIGPCANLACPDSQPGSRVKRYSHDLCCDCFKLWKSGELVWPPAKLQVQPKTAEAPAEATISGQEETPAKPAVVVAQEEISARVKIPERTYAEIREDLEKALKSSGVTPAERDALARTMKDDADPDYPEDLDRPFSIAGVDFTPPPPAEPVTPPLFSVRNKDLCAFNKAAVLRFGLDVYSYARVILSVDGQSIGIKFYVRERNGAIRVQHRQSREVVISSREFVRSAEHLLRKKAVLEPTEWDGFFLARFGGQEAA